MGESETGGKGGGRRREKKRVTVHSAQCTVYELLAVQLPRAGSSKTPHLLILHWSASEVSNPASAQR